MSRRQRVVEEVEEAREEDEEGLEGSQPAFALALGALRLALGLLWSRVGVGLAAGFIGYEMGRDRRRELRRKRPEKDGGAALRYAESAGRGLEATLARERSEAAARIARLESEVASARAALADEKAAGARAAHAIWEEKEAELEALATEMDELHRRVHGTGIGVAPRLPPPVRRDVPTVLEEDEDEWVDEQFETE